MVRKSSNGRRIHRHTPADSTSATRPTANTAPAPRMPASALQTTTTQPTMGHTNEIHGPQHKPSGQDTHQADQATSTHAPDAHDLTPPQSPPGTTPPQKPATSNHAKIPPNTAPKNQNTKQTCAQQLSQAVSPLRPPTTPNTNSNRPPVRAPATPRAAGTLEVPRSKDQ